MDMGDPMMRMRLAPAPTQDYLGLSEALMQLQTSARRDPWLILLAKNAGAPLNDDIASFIFGTLASRLGRQARGAKAARQEAFAPRVVAAVSVLGIATQRMNHWVESLGIKDPPSDRPRVAGTEVSLPARLIERMRHQFYDREWTGSVA